MRETLINEVKSVGLHNFLVTHGVSLKQLEKSKNEIIQTKDMYFEYFDNLNEVLENKKINTNDIKGVTRVFHHSWFQAVNYGLIGVPPGIELNVVTLRFASLLSLFYDGNLDYVFKMYSEELLCGCKFYEFEKNGVKEYFLAGDGNHRTMTAKLIGVETITVGKIYRYSFNKGKHDLYKQNLSCRKKFDEFIKNSSFSTKDFYGENWIYRNEEMIVKGPFNWNYRYSNALEEIQNYHETIEYLTLLESHIKKYYKIFKFSPKWVLKIILFINESNSKENISSKAKAISANEALLSFGNKQT
ncbi:hypothetical protein JZO73_10750 [Enterococcus plantarum]|uniref:hypothetical protein n=1 Tax=Enterococcus plantarum TaxID=1077675 RepID=UPI001A8CCCD4|nr:hypothetical protein [Enterococcus plantarum]MBO0468007.1 hypothetical protein [Enterococcus plantarum]